MKNAFISITLYEYKETPQYNFATFGNIIFKPDCTVSTRMDYEAAKKEMYKLCEAFHTPIKEEVYSTFFVRSILVPLI